MYLWRYLQCKTGFHEVIPISLLTVIGEASILLHYVACFSTPHYRPYEHRFGLKTNDVGCCVAVETVSSGLCLHPSASAGSHGADCRVAELRHGRSRCHNVLLVVPQPTATTAMARCSAAGKGGEQGFAETRVHEAVNNWVDTGRGVAQQMDESDRCPGEGMFGREVIKSPPGVGTVQWHPAEKEQDNDHHQHADYSLLGLQLSLRCVAARSLCLDCPA